MPLPPPLTHTHTHAHLPPVYPPHTQTQIRDRDKAIHNMEQLLRRLSDDPSSGVTFVEDSRWMAVFREVAFQVGVLISGWGGEAMCEAIQIHMSATTTVVLPVKGLHCLLKSIGAQQWSTSAGVKQTAVWAGS